MLQQWQCIRENQQVYDMQVYLIFFISVEDIIFSVTNSALLPCGWCIKIALLFGQTVVEKDSVIFCYGLLRHPVLYWL